MPLTHHDIATGPSIYRHATTDEDVPDQMTTVMEAELPPAERARRKAEVRERVGVGALGRAISLDSGPEQLLDAIRSDVVRAISLSKTQHIILHERVQARVKHIARNFPT